MAILLLHKSPKKIVVNPRNNIYLCRFAKKAGKFIQNLYNYDQKQFNEFGGHVLRDTFRKRAQRTGRRRAVREWRIRHQRLG